MSAFGRPLHRLLLGEALAQQRVDQQLDESGRDRLARSPPSGVIGDQVPVPPEVALQGVHRPRQRREPGVAAREVPHAPLDPIEPLEGALDFAVPQVPLHVLECFLQLASPFRVQTRQPLEELAQAGDLHRQVEPIEQML